MIINVTIIRPVTAVTSSVFTNKRQRSATATLFLVSVYLWPKAGLLELE